MKRYLSFLLFLGAVCISSEAAIISTTLNSKDLIRGEVQSSLSVGYTEGTTSSTIGVSGSNGSQSRRHDNLVYGFALPTLAAGQTLSAATFEFTVTTYGDQTAGNGDVNLDYYVLNTTNPNTGADGIGFFRKDNSPGANELLVGQLDAFAGTGGTSFDIDPDSAGEVSAALSGASLAYMQSLYDASGNPTQAEVFFRLNIDSDNSLLNLDRFIINNSSPALTLTTIPEPSTTALLGLAGLALILRRCK